MIEVQAKNAYPSSAPPLPYNFPSITLGVYGPVPSIQPFSKGGYLSMCPYIKIVFSESPLISAKTHGVLSSSSIILMEEF